MLNRIEMLMCGLRKETNGLQHWWCWESLELPPVSSGHPRETSLLLEVVTVPLVCATSIQEITGGPRRKLGSPSDPLLHGFFSSSLKLVLCNKGNNIKLFI